MDIDILRKTIKDTVNEIEEEKFLNQIFILLVRHLEREKEK